jgi:hypothetical protein
LQADSWIGRRTALPDGGGLLPPVGKNWAQKYLRAK